MHSKTASLLGLAAVALGQGGLIIDPKNADDGVSVKSIPIDISSLFNNRGFAKYPGDANFDGVHSGYPAQYLPEANLTYAGVNFDFPQYKAAGNDNALAQGQMLSPPRDRYISVHMLAAADQSNIATGMVNATYADNSTSTASVLVDPFWDWPYPYGGDIIFPYYYSNKSIDYNRSMIFHVVARLDSTKDLTSLILPNVASGSSSGPGGAAEPNRLHIFAVSMVPATGSGISLEVEHARSTQLW